MGLKGFWDDIEGGSGLLPDELSLALKVVTLGSRSVYIQGIRILEKYSAECVRVRAKDGSVCVYGSGLKIKELSRSEITLTGRITKVEYC